MKRPLAVLFLLLTLLHLSAEAGNTTVCCQEKTYGGIIVETKLRDTTPMSKGQRAAEKHVKDNNKMFEVRTQIEQFRLNPGNEILVTDFKPIYKYSK